MSFLSRDNADPAEEPAVEVANGARLIPRITIQAFCEHSQTAQLVESAVHDRRMSKVALTTHNGGLEGAIETYKANPTPNLIIVETSARPEEIPSGLERLAEVCDASTRLIVLGHVNDVLLYRELIRSGVSEYIVRRLRRTRSSPPSPNSLRLKARRRSGVPSGFSRPRAAPAAPLFRTMSRGRSAST
jgi:pilus assembly protein CpaE